MIGVYGHGPRELGGYGSSNPFRAYFVNRLRGVLRENPRDPVVVVVDIGAGFWACEVLRELDRYYYALPAVPRSGWTAAQWESLRTFTAAERASVLETDGKPRDALLALHRDHSPLDLRTRDPLFHSVNLSLRALGGKVSGPDVRVGDLLASEPGVTSLVLRPEELPPAYRFLGVLEEVRHLVTPEVLRGIRSAAAGMKEILPELHGWARERARARLRETELLAEVAAGLLGGKD